MTGGRTVTPAIVGRAQVRTAFQDLARDMHLRLAGIEAAGLVAAARIFRHATGLDRSGAHGEPVRCPFPDIADHVAETIAVRRESTDRRRPFIAVIGVALIGKHALPGIGHELPFRIEIITPGEFAVVIATLGGELPFGLGRQDLPGPPGVGLGIGVSDMDHRMIVQAGQVAAGTIGMTPVGAENIMPPVVDITHIHRTVGFHENQ